MENLQEHIPMETIMESQIGLFAKEIPSLEEIKQLSLFVRTSGSERLKVLNGIR